MMDQDKKASFNWIWFVVAVFVYGVIVSLFNGADNAEWRSEIKERGDQSEVLVEDDVENFEYVLVDGSHEDNTCWFKTNELFTEKVQIFYPDFNPDTGVLGTWDYASSTIELMQPDGLNIQTVAHEVSHLVDDFMSQQPDIDPHYRAYMQGFWTWCVYEIMLEDIKDAQESKFGFSD